MFSLLYLVYWYHKSDRSFLRPHTVVLSQNSRYSCYLKKSTAYRITSRHLSLFGSAVSLPSSPSLREALHNWWPTWGGLTLSDPADKNDFYSQNNLHTLLSSFPSVHRKGKPFPKERSPLRRLEPRDVIRGASLERRYHSPLPFRPRLSFPSTSASAPASITATPEASPEKKDKEELPSEGIQVTDLGYKGSPEGPGDEEEKEEALSELSELTEEFSTELDTTTQPLGPVNEPVTTFDTPVETTTTMPDTVPKAGAGSMPVPGSKRAPYFNGKDPSELLDFFETFEDLAKEYSLSDAEKCKHVVKYGSKQVRRFWASLEAYKKEDWAKFKEAIMEEYPGAKKGERYTFYKLESIVEKQSTHRIKSDRDMVKYYTKFRPVALALQEGGRISSHERDRMFWRGLHYKSQRRIMKRLEVVDGKDFDRAKVPTMERVVEAGKQVFTREAFDREKRSRRSRRG
ncbi:hypothetical protein H0H93_016772, partial [Arthromyces matolae]